MTALRADRYSQAVGLSTRSRAPAAMLRTSTSWAMSAATSSSRTRAAMKDRSRSNVSPQVSSSCSLVGRSSSTCMAALLIPTLLTNEPGEGRSPRPPCVRRAPRSSSVPIPGNDPATHREHIVMTTSRLQLALNVTDIDAATTFYRDLFGVEPAKQRPGYANFEIPDPPLKLVLFENPGAASPLNHLGVELASPADVT